MDEVRSESDFQFVKRGGNLPSHKEGEGGKVPRGAPAPATLSTCKIRLWIREEDLNRDLGCLQNSREYSTKHRSYREKLERNKPCKLL